MAVYISDLNGKWDYLIYDIIFIIITTGIYHMYIAHALQINARLLIL